MNYMRHLLDIGLQLNSVLLKVGSAPRPLHSESKCSVQDLRSSNSIRASSTFS